MVFFNHRKTGGFVCLFLAICLWFAQMQVDVDRFFMPSESARNGMVFLFSSPRVRAPDVISHRSVKISEKAEEDSRSGSYVRQNVRDISAVAASFLLFSTLYYMQVYMSYNRHLYFSGTLIRYIQNQNGL